MNQRDYKAAADELRAATTAYRTMMGRWLVDTSKWKAENLERYTWVIPPGTYILPPGEPLYMGAGARVDGNGVAALVCEVMNQFAVWPPLPPYDWSEGHRIEYLKMHEL